MIANVSPQPDENMPPLRRSVLCLPASNGRAIAKLPMLDMDGVILDLEDAVAEDMKQQGRDNILGFCRSGAVDGRETIIRINDSASAHHAADLRLVLDCQPDAVLLPKVHTRDDILRLSDYLDDNNAPDTLRVWAMMETPLAVLHASAIAETGRTSGGRLDCLVVGLNDLRKDTGVAADPARTFVIPWLMQVVLAGRAFGLTVLDSVSNDFRNLEPFATECEQGRAMGFEGKMLIHPAQIHAANLHFQPSADEVAEAERIIKAFTRPEAENLNALNIDGHMVERLHFQQALTLMARVEHIKTRTARS